MQILSIKKLNKKLRTTRKKCKFYEEKNIIVFGDVAMP